MANDVFDNGRTDREMLDRITRETEQVDKAQWGAFLSERIEKSPGAKKGKRRTQSDYYIERIRKAKRLLRRALKEVETMEKEFVKIRKEEVNGD